MEKLKKETKVMEVISTAGGAMAILSFLKDAITGAKGVYDVVQDIRQKTPVGPQDNAKFEELLLKLDGENPSTRPMRTIIQDYRRYLHTVNRKLEDAFVFITALHMSEAMALAYLDDLALTMVDEDPVSKESHQLRDQKIRQLMDSDGQLLDSLKDKLSKLKVKEHLEEFSAGFESDLETSGLQSQLESFNQNGWDKLAQRRAARAAKNTTGGTV